MSGLWAVTVREIRERRFVLLAALALGLLPPVGTLVPAARRLAGGDAGEPLALLLGLAFPTAVALGLGASVICRDVAERRLGFYFARPISGLALWGGKMAAVVVLAGASGLLVSLPLVALGALGFTESFDSLLPSVLPFAAGLALIAAAAHAGGTMLRSRSGLLPLDLVLFLSAGFAFAAAAWRVVDAGAPGVFLRVGPTLTAGLLAALLGAGAAQVVFGRADARRGHLFLSATLWASLLSGIAGLHIALSWALSVAPGDVARDQLAGFNAAPRGDSFALDSGRSDRLGYRPVFLVNAATGGFVRLGSAETLSRLIFSLDGRRAAWIRYLGPRPPLFVALLDGPQPVVSAIPRAVGPHAQDHRWPISLSGDGRRLLVGRGSGADVLETATGRLVAETSLAGVSQGSFDSANRVRLYRRLNEPGSRGDLALVAWNLESGETRETGRVEGARTVNGLQGNRLLVSTWNGAVETRDADSGARLDTLVPAGSSHRPHWEGRFLEDGRVSLIAGDETGWRLRVFSADGDALADVPIGRAVSAFIAGESRSGDVVVGVLSASFVTRTLFVDVSAGGVRAQEEGLLPDMGALWSASDPRLSPAPGSLGTRLFSRSDGALVDRDPTSGAQRILVPGRAKREE